MRILATRWMAVLLTVFTAWFLFESLGLSEVASAVPRFVSSLTLLLLIVELIRQSGAMRKTGIEAEFPPTTPASRASSRSIDERLWGNLAWIAAVPTSIWLFGLSAGSALYCLLFLKWRSGETWPISLAFGLGVGVLLYLLFRVVMKIGIYEGVMPWP